MRLGTPRLTLPRPPRPSLIPRGRNESRENNVYVQVYIGGFSDMVAGSDPGVRRGQPTATGVNLGARLHMPMAEGAAGWLMLGAEATPTDVAGYLSFAVEQNLLNDDDNQLRIFINVGWAAGVGVNNRFDAIINAWLQAGVGIEAGGREYGLNLRFQNVINLTRPDEHGCMLLFIFEYSGDSFDLFR